VVTSTSASGVGETTATLNGALDPNGSRAKAHFEYLSEAEYVAAGNSFSGATPAPAKDIIVDNQVEGKGSSEAGSTALRAVSAEKGTFVAGQTIKAKDVLPTGTTIDSLEADPAAPGKLILYLSAKALETKAGATFTATGGAAIGSGDISFESSLVTDLATASGTFTSGQSVSGPGIPANTTIAEVPGPTELRLSRPATTTTAISLTAASGQPVSTSVEGLAPQTKYLMRLVAERTNGSEQVFGPTAIFYTLSSTPTFPECPTNEPFRSGTFAPFGHPSDALPDCRAYEQASPLNKNGGDVLGETQFSKAADDGSGVTFGASFGVPGAEGAQERPFYLTTRGKDGWTTTGLFPPPSSGQKAWPMVGWLPDFSAAYASSARVNEDFNEALFELHRDGSPPIQITPYGHYGEETRNFFVGASADASSVLLESRLAFPAKDGGAPIALAKEGQPNVYAWDRATRELHLASVMNTPEETENLLPRGGIAGPYDSFNPEVSTRLGGASQLYYLRDERAVSFDGSVFFTAAGSGQLYQRLNPTAEQSNPGPNGYVEDGHCFEPVKACTVHISATEKTNGISPDGKDPAGPQPAAFQAASADGSVSYFTSSEKLTNDANTGPEQPPAQIGVANLSDPDPNATKNESFLPRHAKGLTTSPDGEYLYWVDPSKNSIGRAKLNPDGSHGAIEDDFIVPGPTTYEPDPEGHPGETEETPSVLQYVAVGPCAEGGECVYWTNRGPINQFDVAITRAGTIGRATIKGGRAADLQPAFIPQASNPRGIAVNHEDLFWANSPQSSEYGTPPRTIARIGLAGNDPDLDFLEVSGNDASPTAVVSTPSRLYFGVTEPGTDSAYLRSAPLGGGEIVEAGANHDISSLTAADGYIYWSNPHAIGRIDQDLTDSLPEFIGLDGSPTGVAISGIYLFYATNGEAPTNAGTDLYRHTLEGRDGCAYLGGCLEDLTPDSSGLNGAEVQGVLGASADGSHVYFAANADLDGSDPARSGNCHGPSSKTGGSCSLYLWNEGDVQLVARLRLGGGVDFSDAIDWLQSPIGKVGGGTASFVQKSSFLSPDGETFAFRSAANPTEIATEGMPQYYRYHVDQGLACLTCSPSGAGGGGSLQSARVNNGLQAYRSSSLQSHHLSADGDRFFFESTSALVAGDINGASGCPNVGSGSQEFFSCQDVYEWEAPGSGTCTEGGPAYSPANRGCLYLISTGTSEYPSFFVDASASGNDVFFLTRDQLVGQDTDSLQDVYDARVDGGLVSQNQPPAIPCENEGCKNEAGPPPQFSAPPQISGPGNPPIKRKPCKPKKGKKRCAKHRKHQNRNRPTTNNHGGLR
jgi:hypothetical protein